MKSKNGNKSKRTLIMLLSLLCFMFVYLYVPWYMWTDCSFYMKVLGKCQLQEAVQEKEEGLDSSGKLVEYDEPMNLIKREGSLFGKLVKEYWSHFQSAESH
ncbi:ABC transporter C family member 10 [Spatholobus suberectus]|nr:ABC transporter C family member 10 [Spatholobus suberectus]